MKQAYFCARVKNFKTDSKKAEAIAEELGYSLWKPEDNVFDHEYPNGAVKCKMAIDNSSVVICQPPIGNDCSWELGYAHANGKPIYVIGSLPKDDWMTKIGVKYV